MYHPDPLQVQGGSYVTGAERHELIEDYFRGKVESSYSKELLALQKKHLLLLGEALRTQIFIKPKTGQFYFITINPITDDFDLFKNKVEKLLTRPFIIDPIYAYEQRGTTNDDIGKGYHVHIISKKKKYTSPAELQKNIYSQFKNILGNIKHVDIRSCPMVWYDEKLSYIKGDKWDLSKTESCNLNRVWRKQLNLETFYL